MVDLEKFQEEFNERISSKYRRYKNIKYAISVDKMDSITLDVEFHWKELVVCKTFSLTVPSINMVDNMIALLNVEKQAKYNAVKARINHGKPME